MTPPSADRLLHLWLHRLGAMGREVKQTLAWLVRPGMAVLDIGANQGVFTMLLSELVKPQGRVDAFEPDPVLFEAMSRNLSHNAIANTHAHRVAVGEAPGVLRLHRSAVNSGDNRLGSGWALSSGIDVPLDTLDARIAHAVDFIKMDVQGHELAVLRGATRLLERSPRLKILTEFWPGGLRLAGDDPAALLRFMLDHGFRLYDPADWSRPREIVEWLRREHSCDVLAVRD